MALLICVLNIALFEIKNNRTRGLKRMYNTHHITSKLIYITLLLYYNCIIRTKIKYITTDLNIPSYTDMNSLKQALEEYMLFQLGYPIMETELLKCERGS